MELESNFSHIGERPVHYHCDTSKPRTKRCDIPFNRLNRFVVKSSHIPADNPWGKGNSRLAGGKKNAPTGK